MSTANFTSQLLPATFFEPKEYNSYHATGLVLLLISAYQYYKSRKSDINVPAVGPSGRLTSYYGAIKYVFNARVMLLEGYEKYKGATFKVPFVGGWHVVLNKPELVEEVFKAPDNKLSIAAAFDQSLQIKHTMGPYVYADRYHEQVIRSKLTSNFSGLFDDIKDEIAQAFSDNIVLEGSDWKAIPALKTMTRVVCRTSNRVFVGLPLCRNKEYINLNIRFTREVAVGARFINLFPEFLKGIAGDLFTSVPRSTRQGVKLLEPVIEYRLKQYELHGRDWPGKPNDLLSWLMDEAQGEDRSVLALTQRMLTVNFVAIHTSSMSFTQALFELAYRPEYIEPLREEVESVIKSEGWTKPAMAKMRKLDSFMRESQRYNGIGMTSLQRVAVVDYTLSDGTRIPKGTFIESNLLALHRGESRYTNPDEFDGFRFCDTREEEGEGTAKGRFVTTGVDFLPFGHGRHACPGRFFAANELKCMMAYVLLNYEFKFEDGTIGRPKNVEIWGNFSPNRTANLLFRKRQS